MSHQRPDLSGSTLLQLLGAFAIVAIAVLFVGDWPRPGAPFTQGSAALGALLLLAPAAFLVMKRSGRSASPPTWFAPDRAGSRRGRRSPAGSPSYRSWGPGSNR